MTIEIHHPNDIIYYDGDRVQIMPGLWVALEDILSSTIVNDEHTLTTAKCRVLLIVEPAPKTPEPEPEQDKQTKLNWTDPNW
jgi:hypothetical protein